MGVFLRWGVFGIIVTAALLYAFNASKRLSERNSQQVVSESDEEDSGSESDPESDPEESDPEESGPREPDARETELGELEVADETTAGPEPELEMPALCAEEERVAERALKMRRDGATLDQLLRIDLITRQPAQERRERLEAVGRHWYQREGRDPVAAELRAQVLRDCSDALEVSPAP